MIQWIAFALGSALLGAISWTCLQRPDSHGFYRFFAWEAILALIVSDAPNWFRHGLAWYQIISWILLCTCIVPLVLGVQALRTKGRPDRAARPDPHLLAFERTTKLVSSGIYGYIRHPLYTSLLLLGWGVFFKTPSQEGITLVLLATLFLHAAAEADERECILAFGAPYQEYRTRTKMFIPYVF